MVAACAKAQESWRITYNDNPVILMRYADVLLMWSLKLGQIELGAHANVPLVSTMSVPVLIALPVRKTNDYPSITTTASDGSLRCASVVSVVELRWENLASTWTCFCWHQFENAFDTICMDLLWVRKLIEQRNILVGRQLSLATDCI